jgi:cyanate lyase
VGGGVMTKQIRFAIDELPAETANALAQLLGLDTQRIADLGEYPIRVQIVNDQAVVWVTSIFITNAQQLLDTLKDRSHEID